MRSCPKAVLFEAIEGGHEKLVTTSLVLWGADLNTQNYGGLYLFHAAAFRGFDEMVSTLLLRGADKDERDATTGILH